MSTLKAEDIVHDLERTIPVLQEEAEKAMNEALTVAQARWAEQAPGNGPLAHDTTPSVRTNATGVSGSVRPKTAHLKLVAGYLDKGTGLYVAYHSAITPKAVRKVANQRAALKFADGSFRRSSKGIRPTNFIQRTKDVAAPEVEDILSAGAQNATDRLFR